MANLGNAWHIPGSPEPRGLTGMRHPIGAIVPGMAVTICSGNQYQGAGGNPGNQLQVGSAVLFKRSGDAAWQARPMLFRSAVGNNKYYTVTITMPAIFRRRRRSVLPAYSLRRPRPDVRPSQR